MRGVCRKAWGFKSPPEHFFFWAPLRSPRHQNFHCLVRGRSAESRSFADTPRHLRHEIIPRVHPKNGNRSAFTVLDIIPMDIVDLPVVPIETSLREALDIMKRANRSAVIGHDDDDAWLFRAAWVVWGIAGRKKRLADLELKQRVHTALPSDESARAVDFDNPHRSRDAVEKLLDSVVRPYLMRADIPFGGMTRIITRHESLGYDFGSGPADCYCTNPNRSDDPHSYDQSRMPKDGKCTYDGSRIVCS